MGVVITHLPVTVTTLTQDQLFTPWPWRRASTRGDTFRHRWARHDVHPHRAGAKRINHPLVGELTFTYEITQLTTDDGLYLILCSVPPGSRDTDALNLLASWNTPHPAAITPDLHLRSSGDR